MLAAAFNRTVFPGDHSRLEPPDPIPNSAVKQTSADDSVGFPHVKVGHCQGFIPKKRLYSRFFFALFLINVVGLSPYVYCRPPTSRGMSLSLDHILIKRQGLSAGSGQQINAGNSGRPLDSADMPRKVGVCRTGKVGE